MSKMVKVNTKRPKTLTESFGFQFCWKILKNNSMGLSGAVVLALMDSLLFAPRKTEHLHPNQ